MKIPNTVSFCLLTGNFLGILVIASVAGMYFNTSESRDISKFILSCKMMDFAFTNVDVLKETLTPIVVTWPIFVQR